MLFFRCGRQPNRFSRAGGPYPDIPRAAVKRVIREPLPIRRLLGREFISEITRHLRGFAPDARNTPDIGIPRTIRGEIDPFTIGRNRNTLDQLISTRRRERVADA